jgi:hypothetical protein
LFANRAIAISAGQLDDFEDGTTMGWQEGSSPNEPTNVATGGPAGANDAFVRNVSSGSFGAGGRMVMFNTAQWTGNYTASGIARITANMANFGSTTLHMRVAVRRGSGMGPAGYASTSAAVLPADGIWRSVTFDLTSSTMTNVSGADTLATVLANVLEVRILSAAGGPNDNGDVIAGTLGVDNIRAVGTRITQIVFVGNVPRIRFTTITGRSYRVERKNALTDANWLVLSNATNVAGTGSEVDVDDIEPDAGNLPSRFYRVVLLPP